MSGIVALFFSGICHSHYTYYSASPPAQVGGRSAGMQGAGQARAAAHARGGGRRRPSAAGAAQQGWTPRSRSVSVLTMRGSPSPAGGLHGRYM